MFKSILVLAVLALESSGTSVCSQPPYKQLLPLSNFPKALAFCSSKFPLKPCTSTVTSISTFIATSTITTTAATNSVPTATESDTVTTGTTTLETTVATKTQTTIVETDFNTVFTSTSTLVVTTGTNTVTTTVIPPLLKRRNIKERGVTAVRYYSSAVANTLVKRASKTSTTTTKPVSTSSSVDAQAALLSVLTKEAQNILSTACSCIETQPPCATKIVVNTITLTNTLTIPTTATVFVTATTEIDVQATQINSETETDTQDITLTNTISTFTATQINTAATATSTVTQKCPDCYLCTSSSQCAPGFECASYFGFSFGNVNLCSNATPGAKDYTCGAICTN